MSSQTLPDERSFQAQTDAGGGDQQYAEIVTQGQERPQPFLPGDTGRQQKAYSDSSTAEGQNSVIDSKRKPGMFGIYS